VKITPPRTTVTVTLTNDGWAAPAQNRPVRLVIASGNVRGALPVTRR